MRFGAEQSGACCTEPPLGETAALRIACRPDRTWGTTPRSTVAVLSVAIVVWQAATAGGVSRTAHVPSRTFKPTALSHVPCCRCARLHFACRRQTLETPSPRFREGSRHTTATTTSGGDSVQFRGLRHLSRPLEGGHCLEEIGLHALALGAGQRAVEDHELD